MVVVVVVVMVVVVVVVVVIVERIDFQLMMNNLERCAPYRKAAAMVVAMWNELDKSFPVFLPFLVCNGEAWSRCHDG